MPEFRYEGTDYAGKRVAGTIEAKNEFDTRMRLRRLHIRPRNISGASQLPLAALLRRPGLKELSVFTRQFAAMNASGIPLVSSLDAIAEQTVHREFQVILRMVSADVQAGVSLADAFMRHPAVFNRLYCAMVRAGEAAGILDVVLLRLAEYQEKSVSLQRRVRGAFAYPALVSLVAFGALLALFVVVVPTFSAMLAELGADPPLSTKLIIAASELIRTWFVPGGALVAVSAAAAVYAYRQQEKVRATVDAAMMRLPFSGDLQRKNAVARFCRTFGALLDGGVPMAPALEITAATANNRVLEQAFYGALDAIRRGQPLSRPLQESGIFPPMVVQMISAGEKSGNLGPMLARIADFYDAEVDAAISIFTAVLEPALIVVMGVVIAVVLIAMYLPMFEIIGTIG